MADFVRGTPPEKLANRRKVLKLSSWWRINELLEQWHIPLLSTP
jgi:hypothetical protein